MSADRKDDVRPARLESGIDVKPVYGPEDVERTGGWDSIGKPGEIMITFIGLRFLRLSRDRPSGLRAPCADR